MNKMQLKNYDLSWTLLGGQAFNWDLEPGSNYLYGFTTDKVIKLKKENDNLLWQTYPENDNLKYLKKYLRLDVDYLNILKKIQKDKHVKSAIKKYPNLRLLNQDFEQTLLSFMISSNNNIKSIRKIIRMMCQRFGKKITLDGKDVYLFPTTEVIADTKLETLLECKLGFRARFLKSAASHLLKTNLTKEIIRFSESDARNKLKEIKGIGDKITDCILVFSLGFDNVTPLDIWGKRVLTKFYKLNPKLNYEKMRAWINNYFDGYSAWAGQFLFEYIRHM